VVDTYYTQALVPAERVTVVQMITERSEGRVGLRVPALVVCQTWFDG
jgi:hypothetical protein